MKNYIYLIILTLLLSCNSSEEKKTHRDSAKKDNIPAFSGIEANRYNVAFLIMNGTYNTEFTAPFDIFQHTQYRKNIKAMNVFTVANRLADYNQLYQLLQDKCQQLLEGLKKYDIYVGGRPYHTVSITSYEVTSTTNCTRYQMWIKAGGWVY